MLFTCYLDQKLPPVAQLSTIFVKRSTITPPVAQLLTVLQKPVFFFQPHDVIVFSLKWFLNNWLGIFLLLISWFGELNTNRFNTCYSVILCSGRLQSVISRREIADCNLPLRELFSENFHRSVFIWKGWFRQTIRLTRNFMAISGDYW